MRALRYSMLHYETSQPIPNFRETLEEALRDRFVGGLRNEATQSKLLTEHDLTYQTALETAKGMEAAESKTISLKIREPPINKFLNRSSTGTERKTLYRCGKTGRLPNQCSFKVAYCHTCGRRGVLLRCASLPTVESLRRKYVNA